MARRILIRHRQFDRDLAQLIPDPRDAGQFVDAVARFLSEDPFIGYQLDERYWFLATALFHQDHVRQVSLYYEFNEKQISFRALRVPPEASGEADTGDN